MPANSQSPVQPQLLGVFTRPICSSSSANKVTFKSVFRRGGKPIKSEEAVSAVRIEDGPTFTLLSAHTTASRGRRGAAQAESTPNDGGGVRTRENGSILWWRDWSTPNTWNSFE